MFIFSDPADKLDTTLYGYRSIRRQVATNAKQMIGQESVASFKMT